MIYLISGQKTLNEHPEYKQISVEESLNILQEMEELGLDEETFKNNPHTGHLLTLQLGNEHDQCVIDCTTIDISPYKDLIESKPLIIQNAQFDLKFLYHKNIFPENIYDTMLMECILTTGYCRKETEEDYKILRDNSSVSEATEYLLRRTRLEDIAMKYANIKLDKDIRGIIHREGLSPRVIKYAADDVKVLPLIKREQQKEIKLHKEKYGLTEELINLENNAVKVFTRMLYNGIKINVEKYKEKVICTVLAKHDKIIEELELELKASRIHTTKSGKKHHTIAFYNDMFSGRMRSNINWNSHDQKLYILKQLDPTIQNTQAETLRDREDKHPIFKLLVDYSKYKKLNDSFGIGLLNKINKNTGRIHADIWQILRTRALYK